MKEYKLIEAILQNHIAAQKNRLSAARAAYHAKAPDDYVFGNRGTKVKDVISSCEEALREAEDLLKWWREQQ